MDLTIVLPTKNEEASVWKTISDIRRQVVCPIVVVDAHSTDDTAMLASLHNSVTVIFDHGLGKGAALRQAFEYCETDVIFLDVDGTYEIEKIGEFIAAINSGYDVVTGIRRYDRDAEPHIFGIGLFKLGDVLWSVAMRILYGKYVDNLSGYRGLSRRAIEQMCLQEDGWGIETEISCKTIRGGFLHKEILTCYHKRIGESKLGLKIFDKSWRSIVSAMLKYLHWRKK